MEQGEQEKAIIIEPIEVPGVIDQPAPVPEPVFTPEEEEVFAETGGPC